MAVLSVSPTSPGLVPTSLGNSTSPQTVNIIYVNTNDTIATVTAAGYLNTWVANYGNVFANTQMALVYTTDLGPVWLRVLISGTNYSLESSSEAGLITLPTVTNQMVYATNTAGALAAAGVSRIFNAGGVDAGLSGTAGTFRSYPSTAANGYLEVFATANGGARNVTLTNAAHGQTSAYVIPDCGNANGRVLVGASATPFTTAHLLASSGTGGLVADSGIATANVQLKTDVQAAQVTGLGGGGAGPLTVNVTGLTAASVVVVSILASSNTVSVSKVVPGSGSFALTLSADPGATLSIQYVAYIAAQ